MFVLLINLRGLLPGMSFISRDYSYDCKGLIILIILIIYSFTSDFINIKFQIKDF